MIKILFVCHGNICRSPMAEFALKDMTAKLKLTNQFIIASAATSTEEIWNGVGNLVYPPAREELARHGISCAGKRAIQLKKQDYEKYDYLIGMDSANIRNMKRMLGGDPGNKIYKMLDFVVERKGFAVNRKDLSANCGTLSGDRLDSGSLSDHVKTVEYRRISGQSGDVADPWYTGDFGATWRDVEAGCVGFLEFLRAKGEL